MSILFKNTGKPIVYVQAIKILEQRVVDVSLGKKEELLWILEHSTVYTGGTSYDKKDLIDKKINARPII